MGTEWLGDIVSTAASAASGGIFGIFGSVIGGLFKYFKAKQEHSFKKDEWNHELTLLDRQNKRAREEDEYELDKVVQQGSWDALGTSLSKQSLPGPSYKWVDAVKDLYRPALTTGLFILTWYIFAHTDDQALRTYVVNSVVFTACTAGMWWFADRAIAPPGMKNR
jgi:hypothetical protein